MGDVGVLIINTIVALIAVLSLILGFISYKTYKMKEKLDESEGTVASIIALKEAARKLNAASKIHEHRLDHERDEIYGIQKRLDILESGHPDMDIDYGEVDDDANVIAVWFNGKKYVPEDKQDEDCIKIYADNKVIAETAHMANAARSEEKRCCATCRHYRPESGYSTCDLRTWLHATKKYATMADSASNNYEKIVLYKTYKGIIPDDKTEELQKRIADLNYFYNVGLMSAATYMHRWEELMQNDT